MVNLLPDLVPTAKNLLPDLTEQDNAKDDVRTGELGILQRPGGGISTELSITITEPDINQGKPTNIPLLVKGQTNIDSLLSGEPETDKQIGIAIGRARERVSKGGNLPFFESIEQAESEARKRSKEGGSSKKFLASEVVPPGRAKNLLPDIALTEEVTGKQPVTLDIDLSAPPEAIQPPEAVEQPSLPFREIPVTIPESELLGTPQIDTAIKLPDFEAAFSNLGGKLKTEAENITKWGKAWFDFVSGNSPLEDFQDVEQETGFPEKISNIASIAAIAITGGQLTNAAIDLVKIANSEFGNLSPTIKAGKTIFKSINKKFADITGTPEEIVDDFIANRITPATAAKRMTRQVKVDPERAFRALTDYKGLKEAVEAEANNIQTLPVLIPKQTALGTVVVREPTLIADIPPELPIEAAAQAAGPQNILLATEETEGAILAEPIPVTNDPIDNAKPPITGPTSTPPSRPDDETVASTAINQDYEVFKDAWFAEKDWQAKKAEIESGIFQDRIKGSIGETRFGEKPKAVDKAIQIHIDLKRKPEHLGEFFELLTPEQQEIVNQSQNLTPEQIQIADEIQLQFDAIGAIAKDEEIIKNVLDNYTGRIWDVKQPKIPSEQLRKFGVSSRHAKARKFETIIEGWATNPDTKELKVVPTEPGYKLLVEGVTNNLSILKEEIHNTIQDKRFLNHLMDVRNLDGDQLLSTSQLPGYARVEHPNFKVWKFAGQASPQDLRGKNFIQTPEGTLLERRDVYAPQEISKLLNNILGVSKLKGIKGVDAVTKFNAVTKAWILQSSLFHHLAFSRSFYLGGAPFGEALRAIKSGASFMEEMKKLTPTGAFRAGLRSIKEMTPEIELLVRNGMTLGNIQDWEESILRDEESRIDKILEKTKATKVIRDKIKAFRQMQADFLFGQLGAGFKARASIIELRSLMEREPELDPNTAARFVANLMNDDFGGLHLKRIGRNPTTQHIFRIFFLAPDWTESNLRSMVGIIKKGAEGDLYRRFWARIITKSVMGTLAAGALLHGIKKLPTVYEKAWQNGKLRFSEVDITPIYKSVGGKTDATKYFSIIGHFKDPLKFAVDPIQSARYKGSPIFNTIFDAITGKDWAEKQFTEFQEFLSTGSTVRPLSTFAGRPNKWKQVPSFAVNKTRAVSPIQVQKLLGWWQGEIEGFDAIANSLGLGVRSTFVLTKEQKEKLKADKKRIEEIQGRKLRKRK